jgi:hypothetical protein
MSRYITLNEVKPWLVYAPCFTLKEGCKPCYNNVNFTIFK